MLFFGEKSGKSIFFMISLMQNVFVKSLANELLVKSILVKSFLLVKRAPVNSMSHFHFDAGSLSLSQALKQNSSEKNLQEFVSSRKIRLSSKIL